MHDTTTEIDYKYVKQCCGMYTEHRHSGEDMPIPSYEAEPAYAENAVTYIAASRRHSNTDARDTGNTTTAVETSNQRKRVFKLTTRVDSFNDKTRANINGTIQKENRNKVTRRTSVVQVNNNNTSLHGRQYNNSTLLNNINDKSTTNRRNRRPNVVKDKTREVFSRKDIPPHETNSVKQTEKVSPHYESNTGLFYKTKRNFNNIPTCTKWKQISLSNRITTDTCDETNFPNGRCVPVTQHGKCGEQLIGYRPLDYPNTCRKELIRKRSCSARERRQSQCRREINILKAERNGYGSNKNKCVINNTEYKNANKNECDKIRNINKKIYLKKKNDDKYTYVITKYKTNTKRRSRRNKSYDTTSSESTSSSSDSNTIYVSKKNRKSIRSKDNRHYRSRKTSRSYPSKKRNYHKKDKSRSYTNRKKYSQSKSYIKRNSRSYINRKNRSKSISTIKINSIPCNKKITRPYSNKKSRSNSCKSFSNKIDSQKNKSKSQKKKKKCIVNIFNQTEEDVSYLNKNSPKKVICLDCKNKGNENKFIKNVEKNDNKKTRSIKKIKSPSKKHKSNNTQNNSGYVTHNAGTVYNPNEPKYTTVTYNNDPTTRQTRYPLYSESSRHPRLSINTNNDEYATFVSPAEEDPYVADESRCLEEIVTKYKSYRWRSPRERYLAAERCFNNTSNSYRAPVNRGPAEGATYPLSDAARKLALRYVSMTTAPPAALIERARRANFMNSVMSIINTNNNSNACSRRTGVATSSDDIASSCVQTGGNESNTNNNNYEHDEKLTQYEIMYICDPYNPRNIKTLVILPTAEPQLNLNRIVCYYIVENIYLILHFNPVV